MPKWSNSRLNKQQADAATSFFLAVHDGAICDLTQYDRVFDWSAAVTEPGLCCVSV